MVPLLCKSVCQLNVVEYYFGVSSCVLFDLKSRNKNNKEKYLLIVMLLSGY